MNQERASARLFAVASAHASSPPAAVTDGLVLGISEFGASLGRRSAVAGRNNLQ